MLKILLIGYGILAESLLRGIVETDHIVVGFLSWDRRRQLNRFQQKLFPDTLELLRRKHNIHAIDLKRTNSYSFIEKATALEPDIILVGSWGEIFKQPVIDIPTRYCINCHPSLLPKHRGSNPYSSVILQGEKETGVTFHQIDEDIDTGHIIMQEKILIDHNDTGEIIRYKCCMKAKQMVPALLDNIYNNKVSLIPQNHAVASYYPRIKASDGAIKWDKSAQQIHDQIRGLIPWVTSYAVYNSKIVLIGKSTIVDIEPTDAPPGTVLKVIDLSVIVSTSTRSKGLLLEDLSIFGLNSFISKRLLKISLKVGKVFTDAM